MVFSKPSPGRPRGWWAAVPVLAALAIGAGWCVARTAPDVSAYAASEPPVRPGQLVFGPEPSGEVHHPIFDDFRRGWGRPLEDLGRQPEGAWKVRMRALVALAQLGRDGVPLMIEALDDRNHDVRALAAQALGLWGDETALPRLEKAVLKDPDTGVRIHAAMALGGISGEVADRVSEAVRHREPLMLVRLHMEQAASRQEEPSRAGRYREKLAAFDLAEMGSAQVGRLAPDFELTDLRGKSVRLSEFAGKKPVVLIFVYGVNCMFCTGQIATLRHELAKFEAMDAQILIVESQEPYRVRLTVREADTPADQGPLRILSDPTHTTAAKYGVAFQMEHVEWMNRPSTFVIDREGILRAAHLSEGVSDRTPVRVLLEDLARSLPDGGKASGGGVGGG